ncbi:MAG: DNA-processing protein DprA [Acidobacteriota bacterium]
MRDQTFFSLALTLVPGLGKQRLRQVVEKCGLPEAVFQLSRAELKRLPLSPQARAALLSGRALREAEDTLRANEREGIRILSRFETGYPELLRQIHDPPLILYCLGDVQLFETPALALVGARRCSVYGREMTRRLAHQLASMGLLVVSGLARGIDSNAHLGALQAGGLTAAVLGNGVDVVYPRETRRLYDRIRDKGCLLSEFPHGCFPAPQNFPVRNRIISGLCYGTIISEAAEFSGSLITARLTLEQNRELWAIPGNITSEGSYGPNYLIKQGAKVVLSVQDVIDELPLSVLDWLARNEKPEEKRPKARESAPLTGPQEQILKLLTADATLGFDWLLEVSGLGLAQLNETLLALEMKGLVHQEPGRRFCRKLV